METQIENRRNSATWDFAAFLRFSSRAVRFSVRGFKAWITLKPGSRPRRVLGKGARRLTRFVVDRPKLARPLRRVVRRFPAMERRLRLISGTQASASLLPDIPYLESIERWREADASALSPRARSIYGRLKGAVSDDQRTIDAHRR